MAETVRAALVGCGRFAARHARHVCLERSVEGLAIDVACDLVQERAQTYAKEYAIPRWTTSYAAVLSDPDVEAVLIVTDPAAHVPLAIQALEAGKAVFCEKPLSTGAAERAALRRALAATGGRLLCGYCYRFVPPFAAAREHVAPAAFSAALVLSNERGGLNFLLHNACHAVDAVLSMHASEVAEVAAAGTACPGQAAGAEQFVVRLRFADGSLAGIVCGGSGAGAMLPKWYYKFIGQGGGVAEIASRPGWALWLAGREGMHASADYFEGHREELRHFARCVRTGEPFALSVESALRVDEILAEAAAQLGFAIPGPDAAGGPG